ncbi:bifunctional folylpolyglutamate synthase/dihydrofolate synthase [Ornithinibacillus scapharcae]|uniref:bifunctional folylpolyglutamate synthase/dihydrofolate synthase n=1 Tax=Ornithinibacillus scapharcae TaxID=1147159 RepID=UPI000225BF54|nr:folylpolyglutamate synthase/dihydrofolate synthase family protein [Ornithinibacillus scapharcae]
MFQSMDEVNHFFMQRRNLGINPGLDRMKRLLDSQNNPHLMIKTVHIAGTNGKGSTLTFLKDALIHHEYRVGVFSSPSLTGLTGHIRINDNPISDQEFMKLLYQLLPVIKKLDSEEMAPTEFEIITAICFMYFKDHVDIAIIEAGMGGREDSTNCIQPILSIITNIAMDHASFLGDTLGEIAYQKAGIIKENTPVIVGVMDEVSLAIVENEALKHNAPLYQLQHHFTYRLTDRNDNFQRFNWQFEESSYPIEIKMQGEHQVVNVSNAIMALKVLEWKGFRLNWDQVMLALKESKLNGRFEKIHDQPIIVLDGAHNPNGMEAFLRTVENQYKDFRKHLIFAGFRDKELASMIEMASPLFDSVTITTFDHPRAEDPENLLHSLQSSTLKMADWKNIITTMYNHDTTEDEAYFFAGSLHFIGYVRDYIFSLTM